MRGCHHCLNLQRGTLAGCQCRSSRRGSGPLPSLMGWDIPPLRRTSSRPEPPERSPQRAPPPPLPPSRCGASALGACGPAPGDGPPPGGGEAPPPPPRAPGPPRRPSRPAAVRGARPPPPAPYSPRRGEMTPGARPPPRPSPRKSAAPQETFCAGPGGGLAPPGRGAARWAAVRARRRGWKPCPPACPLAQVPRGRLPQLQLQLQPAAAASVR